MAWQLFTSYSFSQFGNQIWALVFPSDPWQASYVAASSNSTSQVYTQTFQSGVGTLKINGTGLSNNLGSISWTTLTNIEHYDQNGTLVERITNNGIVPNNSGAGQTAIAALLLAGNDTITGTAGQDCITGGGGDDTIYTSGGADNIYGGSGSDTIHIVSASHLTNLFIYGDGGGTDTIQFDFAGSLDFRNNAVGMLNSSNNMFGFSNIKYSSAGNLTLTFSSEFLRDGQASPKTFDGSANVDTLNIYGTNYGTLTFNNWTSGVDKINIYGSGGSTIVGTAQDDTIYLGGFITTGGGNDLIVYALGGLTITDFVAGGTQDTIDLQAVTGVYSLADVLAKAQQFGADTNIQFNGSDQIVLKNVNKSNLTAADFIFADNPVGVTINGTEGNDTINASSTVAGQQLPTTKNDTIYGNGGNDSIDALGGANLIYGGNGNDFITASGNLNTAFGDEGSDQLYFVGNQNQLFGGNGNDWLGVSGNNNALVGGPGDEVWMGASGNSNTLAGSAGQDSLYANGGNNWLFGEDNSDWLGCSGNQNQLLGGAGNEWMGATGTANALAGGEGDDTLFSNGSNVLFGENGNDWVGCSGNGNYLSAGGGNDYVAASGDSNLLDGGTGNDTMVAAAGHQGDIFVFHAGYGLDEISGFARHNAGGTDVIDLKGFGFANFNAVLALIADQGGNAVLTINAATILTIDGVQKAQLTASDFLLA